jgi:DNA-binding beta-propeller fold protein YncE
MKTFYSSMSRLRIIAGGALFVTAAALAANALMPPKLPWAVPTVTVGINPVGVDIDLATNTIYVGHQDDNTISVIDGRRCNSSNASQCVAVATMTNVGFGPLWPVFDPATRTLYVVNAFTKSGDPGNTVAVLDVSHCNALDTSGCSQAPVALVTIPGATFNEGLVAKLALDGFTHTLYVGDANGGPVSMINTATCNALQTSGCSQTTSTNVNGIFATVDSGSHSVYLNDFFNSTVMVVNGLTCNATTQSDCNATSIAPMPAGFVPFPTSIDPMSHTVYVPLPTDEGVPSAIAVIDGSTCNGTDRSGCGQAPYLFPADSGAVQILIDQTTRTGYVVALDNSSLTAISLRTCNATTQTGCPTRPHTPALALGLGPQWVALNPSTHTIYSPSQNLNSVWVLDASKCNASKTSGCTNFAPTTRTGAGAILSVQSVQTHTLYVSNQLEGTVSIVDTRVCNQRNLAGCDQTWPTINLGGFPRFQAFNKVKHTLYVANTGWISVIDAATCNSENTSNCAELAQIPVGVGPQHNIVIDEATETLYIENQTDNTISVIDGTHCNATDVSACNQAWPAFAVGAAPQALGFSPTLHTLYVANTNDNTVSVVSTLHCTGSDTSGCAPVATVPVGAGPRAIGIVEDSNSVFIGNRSDLTVSVFESSTCNGSNSSGCPQTPPPAFLVGAFPETNPLGRAIVVDSSKHKLYIPVIGDFDLVEVDTNACRAGHVEDCHVKVANARMGTFSQNAAADDATDTIYVSNFNDGTVSILPK